MKDDRAIRTRNAWRLYFIVACLCWAFSTGIVPESFASPEEFAHFDRTGPCTPFEQVADHLRDAQNQELDSQQLETNMLLAQELGNFAQAMTKQLSKQCSFRGECTREMDDQNQRLQGQNQLRQQQRESDMRQVETKLDLVRFEQEMCEKSVDHMLQRLDEARRR